MKDTDNKVITCPKCKSDYIRLLWQDGASYISYVCEECSKVFDNTKLPYKEK